MGGSQDSVGLYSRVTRLFVMPVSCVAVSESTTTWYLPMKMIPSIKGLLIKCLPQDLPFCLMDRYNRIVLLSLVSNVNVHLPGLFITVKAMWESVHVELFHARLCVLKTQMIESQGRHNRKHSMILSVWSAYKTASPECSFDQCPNVQESWIFVWKCRRFCRELMADVMGSKRRKTVGHLVYFCKGTTLSCFLFPLFWLQSSHRLFFWLDWVFVTHVLLSTAILRYNHPGFIFSSFCPGCSEFVLVLNIDKHVTEGSLLLLLSGKRNVDEGNWHEKVEESAEKCDPGL